jgi:putative inorganic carbon (hco3(-)) transporter
VNIGSVVQSPATPAPAPRWLLVVAATGLGAILAAVPIWISAACLASTVLLCISLQRPIVGLTLAILAIPLSSEISIPVGGLSLTLMEPAVALATVSWVAYGLRGRSLRIWPSALLVAQLAMIGVLVAASVGAENPALSLKECIKWLELVLIFVITVDAARDPTAARWVLFSVLTATTLEAAYGMFQFLTGLGPAFFAIGPFMRAHGHFGQPNPFAGYLGTALPLALALALIWRDPAARWARLLAIPLALGVLLSFSRGAWLGIFAASLVMLAVASQRSRRALVPLVAGLLLLATLGVLGLLPPAVTERFTVVADYFGPFDVRSVELSPENWSVVERMAHWQAGWQMFLDQPLLGLGPGNYPVAYERYYLPGWLEPLGHAHNYYLNLAAETGLVGLVVFLLTLLLAFHAAARGTFGEDPFWRPVAIGVLGVLVATTIHSGVDSLFVHGVAVQFGALLGLAQRASDRAGEGAFASPVT